MVQAIMGAPNKLTKELLLSRCKQLDDGCWLWLYCKTAAGYGQLSYKNKRQFTHRLAYELWRDPVPTGLTLDHLCRNRACMNPTHLEAVTQKTNCLREVSPAALNKDKQQCKRGHTLGANNIIFVKRGRQCKLCDRARNARQRAKNKGLTLSIETALAQYPAVKAQKLDPRWKDPV